MAVELLGASDGIRVEAWVLPYPDSLSLSRGSAYFYALPGGRALLTAGQLRFKGEVNDLVDGLALLVMAAPDQRVRLDGGLVLSWSGELGDSRRVTARMAEDPSRSGAVATFDFDALSGAISQLALAESSLS